MKIWYKILLLFQFMMIPVVMILIVLMVVTHKMRDLHSGILLKNLTSITAAYNVENYLLNLKELKANYMLDGSSGWLEEFDKNVEYFNYWYNQAFQIANTEEERDMMSIMSLEFSKYMKSHKEVVVLTERGEKDKAIKLLLRKSMKHYNVIHKGCEELINTNRTAIEQSEVELKKYIDNSRYLAYGIVFCFIILGILLVMIITRSIVNPIRDIEKTSYKLIPASTNKVEIESLRERFRMMVDALTANQQKMIVSERRAAIGEIAAGISHELNNPIGIIYGFAEILSNRDYLTEEDAEFLNHILDESRRCKKLIGELLDFARTPSPSYIQNNLKNLIRETVSLLKNQYKYKNVKFEIKCPAETPEIEIDAVQIKQVLLNLMINSSEAMDFNGRLNVDLEYETGSAVVSITDCGPGIKKEEIAKIFTPFYTTKPHGVGLGLAICCDIIEKHNGSIDVENGTECGAIFTIRIPVNRNEE